MLKGTEASSKEAFKTVDFSKADLGMSEEDLEIKLLKDKRKLTEQEIKFFGDVWEGFKKRLGKAGVVCHVAEIKTYTVNYGMLLYLNDGKQEGTVYIKLSKAHVIMEMNWYCGEDNDEDNHSKDIIKEIMSIQDFTILVRYALDYIKKELGKLKYDIGAVVLCDKEYGLIQNMRGYTAEDYWTIFYEG